MIKILTIVLALNILVACNDATGDNADGGNDNFKFSKDQLGVLDFDVTSIDFGEVLLQDSRKKFVTINNTGKLPLIFSEFKFNGNNFHESFFFSGGAKEFPGEGGTCPDRLESGASCILAFTYLPLVEKSEEAELEVFYEDGLSQNSEKIVLKGYGGERAELDFSIEAIEFPFSDLSNYQEITFTLTNKGGQVARNFDLSISQDLDIMGRNLFAIIPAATTCPMTTGTLDIGATCTIKVSSTVASDQEYKIYLALLNVNYEYDPGLVTSDNATLDIKQQVVSVEGELAVPSGIFDFGGVVNGFILVQGVLVQNTGYKALSIESVAIAGDGGSGSLDVTDCTERTDETYSLGGKIILDIGETCILDLVFSPNFVTIPFDFTSSSVIFTFNDGKNGFRPTAPFGFTADMLHPARIEIVGSVDPIHETWDVGTTFVANDTRYNQAQSFVIENNGDAIADELVINTTGSPYFSVSHDCPTKLAKGAICNVDIDYTPLKSIYDATASLSAIANATISYKAGDSVSLGVDLITDSLIDTSGVIDNLPHLVFTDFDTSLIGSTFAVAGSSAYHDVAVKNVGATSETSFSLSMTNIVDFFIIDDIGLPIIDGLPNCAHIDETAGSLASGAQCMYRIRSFSAINGDLSSDLTIDFQGGALSSVLYKYNAGFVDPGKLSMDSPQPITKAVIKSYPTFNYPGVGSNTNINDVLVTSYFSGSDRAVDASVMSFPVLPGADTFDFAYVELGYSAFSTPQVGQFEFKNIGDFPITIKDASISLVTDITTASDVTASNYFVYDPSSPCDPSGGDVTVQPSAVCNNMLNYNIPNANLYRVSLSVTYTLGQTTTPLSTDLVEYTSTISVYVQGYDSSSVALLSPTAPVLLVSNGELDFKEVFGGDNSDNQSATLSNGTLVSATDVHYTLTSNGEFHNVLSGGSNLGVIGLSAGIAPLDKYFRLAPTECTGVTTNTIQAAEDCVFDITFTPNSTDEEELVFHYRYHNGVTYEEGSFLIKLLGQEPANLAIQNLPATASPNEYTKDFAEQIVESDHIEYMEIKNVGGVAATNVTLSAVLVPFRIEPSADMDFPTCTATIEPDTTCYLQLVYNPGYPEIEQTSMENISFDWENGVLNLAVPDVVNTTIISSGFAAEKHSRPQGWTSIELAGYNKPYADILEIADIRKGNGEFYAPEELGLVKFKWNQMTGEGAQTNAIVSYRIYKNLTGIFDVRSEIPYAVIPYVAMQAEYEYVDDSLENTPGRVWFYHIVPVRSTYISRIDFTDYPSSIMRAAIPHANTVALHKYTIAMEACKEMGLDINDPANIDLSNNGCIYQDASAATQTYSVSHDTHMDMYEAGDVYAAQSLRDNSAAGEIAVTMDHDDARTACQAKALSFSTTDPVLSQQYTKDLPNRRDHYLLSRKSLGYVQSDCQIVDSEIVLGDQVDCMSDLGLENMAGGLPEWTLAQVDGFGKGIATPLLQGGEEKTIKGIDLKFLFTPSVTGDNHFQIDDTTDTIDKRCFNVFTGMFSPKVIGGCNGDNLISLTDDSGSAGPTTWHLEATEPGDTEFNLFIINSDISALPNFNIFALAGGGDKLTSVDPVNNYSPFTTSFVFNLTSDVGFRCSLRVPY